MARRQRHSVAATTQQLILAAMLAATGGCAGVVAGGGIQNHYAQNTPQTTQDAHRQAITALQKGQWADACSTLSGVAAGDRRALTEFLTVMCMTRDPLDALSADDRARAAFSPPEAPALLPAQRTALNRHRAWIAAIQDDLADAAKTHLGLAERPLPPHLENSKNLSMLKAWKERGGSWHKATYDSVRKQLATKDGATQTALNSLLSGLTTRTAQEILFADLSGMTLPARPAMDLPMLSPT